MSEIKKEEVKTETIEETKEEKKAFSIDTLVGMIKDAAIEAAKKAGFKTRIVEEDGKENMVSMDYKTDRINFTVKNDKIEKAKVG